MATINVAFWNLQNLFDTTPNEISTDLEFTPTEGWTLAAFNAKIKGLAEVIDAMFGGRGPDLLGFCEIENDLPATKALVDALSQPSRYKMVVSQSPDLRGIDTGLIYDKNVFEQVGELAQPPDDKDLYPKEHLIHLRFRTRDVLEVLLRVKESGALLWVLVNHWPSRSRGREASEAYRVTLGNYVGRRVDDILKFSNYLQMSDSNATFKKLTGRWNRNILMMGDLNDEPADRSVLEELKAASGEDKLEEPMKTSSGRKTPTPKSYFKRNAYLYNYMWDLYARPDEGTYFYSGSTNTMNVLDHFIVSRGLFYGCSELLLDPQSVGVFKHGPMTSKKGRPIAFDKKTKKGFSDHFPVVAVINTVSANQASNKCQ